MINRMQFFIFALIFACGGVCSAYFSFESFVSFMSGFVSFALILLGSFLGILKQSKEGKEDIPKPTDNTLKSKNIPKSENHTISDASKFLTGLKLSFSLLRLLCYVGLIIWVILLLEYRVFDIGGFVGGVGASVIALTSIAIMFIKNA